MNIPTPNPLTPEMVSNAVAEIKAVLDSPHAYKDFEGLHGSEDEILWAFVRAASTHCRDDEFKEMAKVICTIPAFTHWYA